MLTPRCRCSEHDIRFMDVICEEDDQDWWTVLTMIQHILVTIHARYEGKIKRVTIFSDNAKCYQSNDSYANLLDLGAPLGIHISAMLHSEVQDGKTEVDAHLGTLKRLVRLAVASGPDMSGKATTARELYDTLCGVARGDDVVALLAKPTAAASAAKAALKGGSIKGVTQVAGVKFDVDGTVTTFKAVDLCTLKSYTRIEWEALNRTSAADRNLQLWSGPNVRHSVLVVRDEEPDPGAVLRDAAAKRRRLQSTKRKFLVHQSEPQRIGDLLPCPVAYCRETFRFPAAVKRHVALGKHAMRSRPIKDVALEEAQRLLTRPDLTHVKATDTAALEDIAFPAEESAALKQAFTNLVEHAFSVGVAGSFVGGWGSTRTRRKAWRATDPAIVRLRELFDEGENDPSKKYNKDSAFAKLCEKFAESLVPRPSTIMSWFSRWARSSDAATAHERRVRAAERRFKALQAQMELINSVGAEEAADGEAPEQAAAAALAGFANERR
jgi:hypothetical protein